MKTRSIVGLYYVMSALTSAGMGFFMGIYSNFLRGAGLDEFWVNMVNVCFFMVITICEIPTGLFADIFGRKGSFVISCFLEMTAFAIYGISRSFGGFVLAETIGAVGKTFSSGAFEAWLVDSLKHSGDKTDLLKIFARRSVISRISVIAASVIGGWLGDRGLNIPFFASSLTYAVCGVTAIVLMKENYFVRSKFSFSSGLEEMKNTWKKSLFFAKSDKNFRFILIISALQMFSFMAPNMEWQRVFKELGFSNSLNGVIGGLINVAIIMGVIFSRHIGSFIREEKEQLAFTLILTGVCIALTVSFVNVYLVILFFFLHEIGRGASGPIAESYTQKCIPSSKERATLASFGSMVGHLGGAVGLFVSGLIAKWFGIAPAWVVSGTVLVIATVLVTKNHRGK